MASTRLKNGQKIISQKWSDEDCSEGMDAGHLDTCELENPYNPGEIILVSYRGVDPSTPLGTREYKKEKRLADNRASAARSRALERLKKDALQVCTHS